MEADPASAVPDAAKASDPSDPSSAFRLGYRPELDGLRALAIVLVFLAHIAFPWPALGLNFLPGAFQGVDLFFVLSGFLLTALLLDERATTGGFSFKGFYRRRSLRLLPPLFFLLVCLIPWTIQQHEAVGFLFRAYIPIVLYVTNWSMIIRGPNTIPFSLGHMWSLAIEEQYYLVFFPLLVLLLKKVKSLRTVAWILAGLIVAVWVDRIVSTAHTSPGDFGATLYLRTDIRADALLWGPLVAVLLHLGWRISPKVRVLAIPAAAYLIWSICFVHIENGWTYTWALGLVNVSWTIVLISILGARHPFSGILRTKPFVWTGKISYGLYLWHLPIFIEVTRHTQFRPWIPHWVAFAIAITGTYAIATFSYYVVERPFLKRKRPRSAVSGDLSGTTEVGKRLTRR